jgi:hypothetical protein
VQSWSYEDCTTKIAKLCSPWIKSWFWVFFGWVNYGPNIFRSLVCRASISYAPAMPGRPKNSVPSLLKNSGSLSNVLIFFSSHSDRNYIQSWCNMRKRSSQNISRDTPKTPSPENLPCKKVRHLPSPPQTRLLRRKGTPTCCNFGKDRQLLYPEYFFVITARSGKAIQP